MCPTQSTKLQTAGSRGLLGQSLQVAIVLAVVKNQSTAHTTCMRAVITRVQVQQVFLCFDCATGTNDDGLNGHDTCIIMRLGTAYWEHYRRQQKTNNIVPHDVFAEMKREKPHKPAVVTQTCPSGIIGCLWTLEARS